MPEQKPYVAAPEFDRVRPDPFAREQVRQQTEDAMTALAVQDGTPQQPMLPGMEEIAPFEPQVYEPSDVDHQVASEVERKFAEWKQDRQVHEPVWYTSAAFFRGQHEVRWSVFDNRLISTASPIPQRSRRAINRIFAKVRARRAKFLKNRPTWVVVPATSDIKDKLDARATGKVLDYIWRKVRLERKFEQALIWAESCSRGYWWFGWDEEALGRVKNQQPDPLTGAVNVTVSEAQVGEVTVEVGSPFEVVVGDPTQSSLDSIDELIRAKVRTLDYIRANYPDRAHLVTAEGSGDTFQFEAQIAALNSNASMLGSGLPAGLTDKKRDYQGNPNSVVVKEYFMRPNVDYPKGKYCVVAAGVLLKEVDELPFGLWDMENPFPCVEFVDVASAGQYWGTTVLEQMVDIQREYNGIRSMISTQIKLMGHPKVFVAKQHQIPEGAWTPDAGEIIEYNARPGIEPPTPWIPPNIVGDAWRMIELLKAEFDDITQIYPASEGKSTGTESGFHANLLQEAGDLVHGPDIRSHEMAIEEAAQKIRRIIKQRYDIPRLITVTSGSYQPEVFEFSAEDVDDYADIVVQAGSALPQLKGARIQAALDLYAKGVLGDPLDPEVRRRLLNVLDLGGMDDVMEYTRIDEDMITIENAEAEDGNVPLASPRFYEDHVKHWAGHINKLKSPAVMSWPSPARMGLLAHAIEHAKYINHAAAYQMSIEAGLEGLIPPPMVMGLPGAPMGMPGYPNVMQPPPGAGAPPGGAAPSPDTGFNEAPDMTPAAGTPSQ
jgi:hypothetical protein